MNTMGPQFETIKQYYQQYFEQLFKLPEVNEDTFLDSTNEEPLPPGLEKNKKKKRNFEEKNLFENKKIKLENNIEKIIQNETNNKEN
jgi:hypothetical protein